MFDIIPSTSYERASNGDPDPWAKRINPEAFMGPVDLRASKFHRINPLTNEPTGEVYSYFEVQRLIVEKHKQYARDFVGYKEYIDLTKRGFASQQWFCDLDDDIMDRYKDSDIKREHPWIIKRRLAANLCLNDNIPTKEAFLKLWEEVSASDLSFEELTDPHCTRLEDEFFPTPEIIDVDTKEIRNCKYSISALKGIVAALCSRISGFSGFDKAVSTAGILLAGGAAFYAYKQYSGMKKEVRSLELENAALSYEFSDLEALEVRRRELLEERGYTSESLNMYADAKNLKKNSMRNKVEFVHEGRTRKKKQPVKVVVEPQYVLEDLDDEIVDVTKAQVQGGCDTTLEPIMSKIYCKSVYHITSREETIGVLTFMKGKVAMMPGHFIRVFETHRSVADVILFKNEMTGNSFELSVYEFLGLRRVEIPNSDTIIVRFPKIHNHPDLTKFVIDKDFLSHRRSFDCVMKRPTNSHRVEFKGRIANNSKPVGDGMGVEPLRIDYVVHGAVTTGPGDCGALIFVIDKSLGSRRILSMHVAGAPHCTALSVPMCLFGVVSELDKFDEIGEDLSNFRFQHGMTPLFHGHVVEEIVDKFSFLPLESKIVPSPLYGAVSEPCTRPVFLKKFQHEGQVYDPNQIMIKRLKRDKFHFINEEDLDLCIEHYLTTLESAGNMTSLNRKKILTFEESVCGIDSLNFFDAIKRKSSPGFPWTEMHPKTHPYKTWWFGSDGDYTLDTPQTQYLKEVVHDMIGKASKGVISQVIYKDFPKDERKPIDKVYKGKVRLVSGSPMHYSISSRMYNMSFTAWFMEARILNGSAVGINPYSSEWDFLHKWLTCFNFKAFAGDFKLYDVSHGEQLLSAVCTIINRWYDDGEENQRIRRVLFESLKVSHHICGNVIYTVIGTLPSGHPLTVIVNTIIHSLLVRLSYLKCFKELVSYNSNVREVVYGDDGIVMVSKSISGLFNQKTFSTLVSSFGYEYTIETKGEEEQTILRDISDVSFLKRKFRFDSSALRVVAPMDLMTVLEICYWVKKNASLVEQVPVLVDCVLRELTLHGKEVYETYARKLLDVLFEEMGIDILFVPHVKLLSEVLNQDYSFTFN